MYKELVPSWKTTLFHWECESCFVSHCLPCHVYAKLKQRNYTIHCMVYIGLWFIVQTLYSWNYYTYSNACPEYDVSYCLQLTESECSQHYMVINSSPSKCVYHTDIELCTSDTYTCIPLSQYKSIHVFIFILLSMIYTCFGLIHYNVRRELREKKEIEDDSYSCLASTCCSTCGLAQEYREL